MISIAHASTKQASHISPSKLRLKRAPIEKKNKIKKKSRRGFRLSAMYCAIGLVAMVMPAINAPISADSPQLAASSASPKL